jgi:hypothetical protein
VDKKKFEKILSDIDIPVEDPRFYPKVFNYINKIQKAELESEADPFKKVVSQEYGELSFRIDQSEIQDSSSVRNILKTRDIAAILVDDEGSINLELIPKMIESLKAHQYSLGPDRQYDAKRNEHLINVLNQLHENKQLVRQLKTIGKPHQHRYAEEVIRDTLRLPPKEIITDAHARKAALSAWLCYLRQNVGSCFATAPAIVVQKEQPAVFLKDIQEMLSTGRLKRTFGGVEYAVPLSFSWGAGDLRRVFLFQKGNFENIKLWKSPGLIAAFEQVGLIEPSAPLKAKTAKSKELILNVLKNWEGDHPWFYTSIETLLSKILLNHIGITEGDVKEYELRPKGMIHGGLLITAQGTGADKGGIGKKSIQFLEEFKHAKDAFKELADNALLKTWEFTLASFSETKSQFTTWNLYSSLGLRPDDKGGIGPKLFEILKQKLDQANTKVNDLQFDYEQAYNHLQYLQRRLRQVTSEEEARYVKIEYQTKSSEFYSLEELRNKFHNKARRYANLYDGLTDIYFRLFPNYFQEVYDADILEVAVGPFDDSPAGFRLLYKHGRSNTSQWTRIQNHTEFVESLVSFFTATETEIVNSPEMKGLEEDMGEIITSIVSHVRSPEFLETAFWRMARAHNAPLIKDPLENLDKIEIKPWVYTSGGALTTLVSCYFRLEDKPTEKSRWVENPMELLVFLIDSIKELPEKNLDAFIENPEKSLLIHSPTHAFLLKPGYPLFTEAWKSKDFTYTWVRDNIVRPMELFTDKIYLDEDKMQYIVDHLEPLVPKNFQHYYRQTFAKLGGSMKVSDYRQYILDTIETTRGLQTGGRGVLAKDQIDSALYPLLPLFPSYQLKERVESILAQLPGISKEIQSKLLQTLEDISGRIGSQKTISAKGLQDIIKAMLAIVTEETSTQYDYPYLIALAAQKEGFAMSTPFIFADTNWVKDHFAFLVNPGSGKFELWRVDYTGSVGAPMSDWKQWLDGSKKKPDWGVYNRPHEYSLG